MWLLGPRGSQCAKTSRRYSDACSTAPRTAGVLAIGSPDSERFHPTMSTEFLARIGDLVSEAVAAA